MLHGMAFSDSIVYDSLRSLIATMGPDQIIALPRISAASGVPERTTRRALERLTIARKIERTFAVGIGYTYRIRD